MDVRVIVHGHALEYFPDPREEFDFEFEPGDTVADMLARLGIQTELVCGWWLRADRPQSRMS